MSKLKYVGPSPTTRRASSTAQRQPRSCTSSIGMTRIPLSSLNAQRLPPTVLVPRSPIWITRFGSSTPSSTARRNGAP